MPRKPNSLDAVLLSVFVALVTLQPYFLHGRLNLFELGIYLPGIEAVLDGQVPYRDFFYLRGPFELYMPAALMAVFGRNVAVLSTYFYVGNVLALIMCVWIAKELYRSRLFFYVMVPVLAARTFPRVVFTYWGGMRYVIGLLAVGLVILYLRRGGRYRLWCAGMLGGWALFTSVEVGACVLMAAAGVFLCAWFLKTHSPKEVIGFFGLYIAGFLTVAIPYMVYLAYQGALIPYADAVLSVVGNMQNVFDPRFTSNVPRGLGEAVAAALNPASKSFKHMTPAYLYLGVFAYLYQQFRRGRFDAAKLGVMALGIYGAVLYITAFRNIEAAQFEVALQPEKILLFLLLEEVCLFWKPSKAAVSRILIGIVILSSAGYAIQRYNHRFFSVQYIRQKILGRDTARLAPLSAEDAAVPKSARLQGLVVPKSQAEDFDSVARFIEENTDAQEPVLMFPELGMYYFLADRPCVGRFPMVSFSWMNDRWHQEFWADIKRTKPRFVVMDKDLEPRFQDTYFKVRKNFDKYQDVLEYIRKNYAVVQETPSLRILKRKG